MYWNPIIVLIPIFLLTQTNAVRLHKMFQFIDGYRSEHNLRGYLHLGYDYAVFLRVPKPHDRFLVYELYETKKIAEDKFTKPSILAISKVPIDFIKEQLVIFRDELYKAKYIDENTIPGTQVKTLREWQLDKAIANHLKIANKPLNLRTVV